MYRSTDPRDGESNICGFALPIAPSLLVFKLPPLHEPLLHLHPLLYPGRRGHPSPGSCASCCLPRPREVWFYVYVYVIDEYRIIGQICDRASTTYPDFVLAHRVVGAAGFHLPEASQR